MSAVWLAFLSPRMLPQKRAQLVRLAAVLRTVSPAAHVQAAPVYLGGLVAAWPLQTPTCSSWKSNVTLAAKQTATPCLFDLQMLGRSSW